MSSVAHQPDLLTLLAGPASIEERFWAFHQEHPEVLEEFITLARQARVAGRERIGGKLLAEVIRWNRALAGRDAEGFKINKSFISRYVRLAEEREPDLRGFFEKRQLRSL